MRCLFLLPIAFLITIYAGGDKPLKSNDYTITIPMFSGMDTNSLDQYTGKDVTAYNNAIDDIVKQLSQSGISNESKVYCVYLLGELRAVQAVTILIDNIDLEATKVDPKDRIGRWSKYPAQEALGKIGKTAVNMILDKLSEESNELRRKLMCITIIDVEGKEIGRYRIAKLLENETNSTAKRNLALSIKLFE